MKHRQTLVSSLFTLLRTAEIADYPRAVNGLQITNSGRISRIVAAVDACEAVIREASSEEGTLLMVHHGLFWNGSAPVTGPYYRKLKAAMEGEVALYSTHLPLDLHPKLGNNALLAKAIGLSATKPAMELKGNAVGLIGKISPVSRERFAKRLTDAVGGAVHMAPGGPATIRKVLVVSGGCHIN